uniref:DNA-directed DNA polymerase family B exonuclease domain-containing protein n=1 Tax=Panagrolaimus davidi TaxID=227884 RepID=A0A914P1V7_9BILA
MLEMTQRPNVDDVITIDDDSEDEEETIVVKKRYKKVEAKYPTVLLEPNQQVFEPPAIDHYANPMSNETWCEDEDWQPPANHKYDGLRPPPTPPPKNSNAQKDATEKFKNACFVKNLTVLSIEALFECNQESVKEKSDKSNEKKCYPNPQNDPCLGIFYVIYFDICNSFENADIVGGCVTNKMKFKRKEFPKIEKVKCEGDIFRWLALILRKYDPDIIVGYDINRLSFNYCIQRAAFLGIQSFNESVSRLSLKWDKEIRKSLDDIRGRIFLNVWKIVRREQPMRHYRLSAVVHEILGKRFADMSQFFIEKLLVDNDPNLNSVVLRHFFRKASLNIQILSALDIFIRTSQMALVYGIQFTEVLTRGSQFRVESMLLRLSNIHEYCPPSVSVEQRSAT